MSDKVDGRCANCGKRKLAMAGNINNINFTVWCQACGSTWEGTQLGDLIEAASRSATAARPGDLTPNSE